MGNIFSKIVSVQFTSIAFLLLGCSMSFSAGTTKVVTGHDKIVVQAHRPPPARPSISSIQSKSASRVVLKKDKIEINEKVMFEHNKSTIMEESFDLLNEVADVIKKNPQIKKIRVEGHTDSDGSKNYNQNLSQQRADSVMKYLIQAGVGESKLESVGFGQDRPIADNSTFEGKEQNRRVEFNIIN